MDVPNSPVPTGGTPGPQGILQQLLKFFQTTGGSVGNALGGGAPMAPGGGGGGTPAVLGAIPASPKPPVPQGSIAASVPSSIPGGPAPSPGAQAVPPAAHQPSPAYQSGFSFPNKAARNAAVVTNMMESLGQFAEKQAQQKYAKQVEEARGVVATMLRMGIAADNSQDPDAKKLLQQKANEMLGAKESAKILKDINKPGSAAYFGAQQAYKDVMAENQQKLTQQELQARIEAEKSRAAAEQQRATAEAARAQHEQKMTEQAGTVTPSLQAQLDAETQRYKSQLEGTKYTADRAYDATKLRVDAIKAKNTGDDKALGALAKEYTNLSTQFKTLGGQAAAIQKDLDDHPVMNWWNDKDASKKKDQLSALKEKQADLQKQLDMIETKRQVMQKFNIIPDITEVPPPPVGQGKGTEAEPIVINQ